MALKMKACSITFLLFFLVPPLFSQTKKIDSLDQLIHKAKSDTARINLLVKKIKLVRNENIDSALQLANKILPEAHAIGYYKGEIDLRNSIATSYCFKGDYKKAEENLKFLETFIKASKDSAGYAGLYSNYGMMYGMQSKYDTSIQFYEKAIGINERINDKSALATNYSNVAIGFQQLSNFTQALFYQQKSLQLAENNNDESAQAYTLVNMGITYTLMRDSVRSEKAYRRSIILAEKNHLKDVELYAYTNLSSFYINKDQWKEGYEFAMKAALLAKKTGDQGTEAASLSKAAVCLAYVGKFSEAMELGKKSILIADSSAQPLNIYQGYSSVGNILKLQKKYTEAIPFYEKGFAALKKADAYDTDLGNSYKELSECYEQNGNFSQALAAYKKYALIEDSARSKDNIQKATELNMNYEFEKKQAISDALQSKKNAEARSSQLLLLGGLLLTMILAAGAWIAFRNKKKANSKLELQKSEIQSTLSQLRTTQGQLIQSEKMASLGELTAGIAHEIQNPLNFVKNFSEVSVELVDDMEEELKIGNKEIAILIADNLRENLQKITHHSLRADGIVKGMLQHSRMRTGQKELTDINTLADEYLRLSYHGLRAKDKSFNAYFKTEFDETIDKLNIVPQDMGRVLLNLYNNAFYAVNEPSTSLKGEQYQPTVTVSTKVLKFPSPKGVPGTGDLGVELTVTDNGNGIPKELVDKIFQPFFTTKPTGQGTGLGLSLSYDIIKAHRGELKVETQEGEGTKFIITLPYK